MRFFFLEGNKIRNWIGAFALLLSTCCAGAAESPSPFEEANRLYEQGKYPEAIQRYETMIKAGRNSAGVYFNLGNAYFKQGQLGRALLNYRKANQLEPRDPDIQANLRFARERVSGSLSIHPQVWQRALGYFTLNELAAAAAILFWTWASLYCAAKFRPALVPTLRGATLTSAALLLISILVLALAYRQQSSPAAIVISKQATLHLGPLDETQTA